MHSAFFFLNHRQRQLFPLLNFISSGITSPTWDPYWVITALSPVLFIVMGVMAILMIVKDELFRRYFVIHILAVVVSSY